MSGSILIIILSRYIDRENCCHVTNKQTNKQTDALLSIKKPSMSSIFNKNHSMQLMHIIMFSLDRTIQNKRKKN